MGRISLLLLLVLSSCNWFNKPKDDHDPNNSSTYKDCTLVPTGFNIVYQGCPSEEGEWNYYQVRRNQDGNVLRVELTCSIKEEDVPYNQANYDDDFVQEDEESDDNFIRSSDCASGSRKQPQTENTYQDIWQKQLD